MSGSASAHAVDVAEGLARRALELVSIPSVSGEEDAILSYLKEATSVEGFRIADDREGVLLIVPERMAAGERLVLLVGHVDTVPVGGAEVPAVRRGGWVIGRGAADMKGALSVMLEIQRLLAAAGRALSGSSGPKVGFLFVAREELPSPESALMPLLLRSDVAGWADLAIVMEPTANALEMGCLGNLNARVTVGGVAAHSARPWQGSNAIHVAIEALGPVWQAPVIEVELGGLIFKEVISVTTIEGGRAANVVPDLVTASVNYRYAPSRTPAEAESRVRELVFGPRVEVDVVGNAPPALPPSSSALVEALREAGNLEVRAKQAWTPVAEFASMGLDAVNFGPGDPSYAHRDDERVEEAAMLRSYEVLRAFLRATGSKEQT